MKISIISGSSRAKSASINVATHINHLLADIDATVDSRIFSVADHNLPMWDENTDTSSLSALHDELATADAFVFVIPEWHGMVPPAVKNLFFLFSGVFRHKPAFLVSVSSGTGGRYPLSEMRATTYKNTFINYIPVSTVIDRVNSVIDENGNYIAEKTFVQNRLDEGLRILIEYGKAFQAIRASGIVQEKRFQSGV